MVEGEGETCEDDVDDDDNDTVEANQQTQQSECERREESCCDEFAFRIKGLWNPEKGVESTLLIQRITSSNYHPHNK